MGLDLDFWADALTRIGRPVTAAEALPHQFYSDPEILELEKEHLFRGGWLLAGASGQLPNAGDVLPVTIIGESLMLVRQPEGEVVCFRNFCRHRGAELVQEPAKGVKFLVCPYHAWSYALEGSLRQAPRFEERGAEQLDKGSLSLCRVRSAEWNGLIFVNLSGQAEAFEDYISAFENWLKYDMGEFTYERTLTFELQANWKLAIENFIEAYHVPSVHGLLNSYSPMTNRYSIVGPTILGQGSRYTKPAVGLDPQALPLLKSGHRDFSESPSVMPNLMLSFHDNFLYTFAVEPLGCGRTRETFNFFFVGEDSLKDELKPMRDAVVERISLINREDIGIVESVHRGRSSPTAPRGRFSPVLEQTTYEFQRRTAVRLARAAGFDPIAAAEAAE